MRFDTPIADATGVSQRPQPTSRTFAAIHLKGRTLCRA